MNWHNAPPFQPVYYPPHPMAHMQHMESLLVQQQQHMLTLMLPQPELPVFGCDPIEYCSFIRAFESIIGSRTQISSSRLYYLVQYTTGDVNELMRSCLTMNTEDGYREARRLLKERYGQDHKIASAYVDQVTTGPRIRAERVDDLRKFSILITSCKNALKDIGYLRRINNPDILKKIVDRLPFDMKRKWCDIADDIFECKHREITIEYVASFIEKRARSASHLVFGDILNQKSIQSQAKCQRQTYQSGRSSGKGYSFGTTGEPKRDAGSAVSQRKCPLRSNDHWLSQCSDFRSKSLEERLRITKVKGLCNNCLVSGNQETRIEERMYREEHGKSEGSGETNGRSCYIKGKENLNSQKGATSLAIVPVKVKVPGRKRVVKTYAFLDNGSNTTFCTEDLMEQLQTRGKDTMLSLTTLGIEDNKTKMSLVPSLQVSDLDEQNLIELPMVFSTRQLPVRTANRAERKEMSQWPHLQEIDIRDIDADVGLLIGRRTKGT
ncbi:uncharacterized protein [Montipora foliosa]|uniref:uncharacterized protein n=1 Tax=Montipora foliosa TaxID=591990 RepID=UPI0035F1862D